MLAGIKNKAKGIGYKVIYKAAAKSRPFGAPRRILNALKLCEINCRNMNADDIKAVEKGEISAEAALERYGSGGNADWLCSLKKSVDSYCDKAFSERSRQISETAKSDVVFCAAAYGFTPEEYFSFKLKDKSPAERREFVSERDRMNFIYKINDAFDLDTAIRSKTKMYEKLKEFYKRDAVIISGGY